MQMHRLAPLVALMALSFDVSVSASSYIIVSDLTNSLIRVKEDEFPNEVPGFMAGIAYTIWNLSTNPKAEIEKKFRKLLESLHGAQQTSDDLAIVGQDGRKLPNVLVRWLSGSLSAQDIVKLVKGRATDSIFIKIAETVFNPRMIAKHTTPLPGAALFIQQCTQLVGAGHVYIAGNWDASSFTLITNRFPFFNQVPQHLRFISGSTGNLLPRDTEALVQQISQQAGVSRNHIIFISAMPSHVKAMAAAGVHALLIQNQNLPAAVATASAIVRAG